MARQITLLKVFVASPEDLKEERVLLNDVIDELNGIWDKDNIQLKIVKWETDVIPGVGEDSQKVINEQIEDDYDIFIGIMWKRFGTPTGRADSGTAEEFYRAYNRYKENPNDIRIMFYFNDAPVNIKDMDHKQLELISKFKKELSEIGVLYWEYAGVENFTSVVRMHLNNQIKGYGKTWGVGTNKVELVDTDKKINHPPENLKSYETASSQDKDMVLALEVMAKEPELFKKLITPGYTLTPEDGVLLLSTLVREPELFKKIMISSGHNFTENDELMLDVLSKQPNLINIMADQLDFSTFPVNEDPKAIKKEEKKENEISSGNKSKKQKRNKKDIKH